MKYKVCQNPDGKPHHYSVCDENGWPTDKTTYGFSSAIGEAVRLNDEQARRYRAFPDSSHPEHWAVWLCHDGSPVDKVTPTLANIADAKAVANILERSVL